jgi:hypothetical protein
VLTGVVVGCRMALATMMAMMVLGACGMRGAYDGHGQKHRNGRQ